MRESTKNKIRNVITAYRQLFPGEYEATVKLNKQAAIEKATPWGEFKDSTDFGREVHRIPTTLYETIRLKLTQQEWDEFQTEKGTLWFTRTFPQFVPNPNIE